jgi:phage shock protein PspC (stress-responsive transcriptional regulator)
MTAPAANLLTRDDTMFGICEAIGEDLGFHPNYLRVTLAVMLLWNPVVVVATYLAAGLVVLASRLIWPNRRRATPSAGAQTVAVTTVADPLPLAA